MLKLQNTKTSNDQEMIQSDINPALNIKRERRNTHMTQMYDKKESSCFLDRCCFTFSYLNLT